MISLRANIRCSFLFIAGLTCLLLPGGTAAQWYGSSYGYFEHGQLLGGHPYDWATYTGNPALLRISHRGDDLNMATHFGHASGGFRRFVDPGRDASYTVLASGSKTIDGRQLFRGSFGFRRSEYFDWQWVSTRFYEEAHPFIMADSTTGRSRFNEILVNGGYAVELLPGWNLGASVEYMVDEGLKDIASKPLSTHRYIRFRAGSSYRTGRAEIGAYGGLDDGEEELRYTEFEGAILEETVLISFRGYDEPVVQRRDRESRLTRLSSWHYGAHAAWTLQAGLRLHAQYRGWQRALDVEEDITRPRMEGHTSANSHRLDADMIWPRNRYLLALGYRFLSDEQWGEFQPFNVLMNEMDRRMHRFVTGWSVGLGEAAEAGVQWHLAYGDRSERDYYSDILWSADQSDIGFNAGITARLTGRMRLRAHYGFLNRSSSNIVLETGDTGPFFDEYRRRDIEFMLSGFTARQGSLEAVIRLDGNHEITAEIELCHQDSQGSARKRRTITSVLTYRIPLQ